MFLFSEKSLLVCDMNDPIGLKHIVEHNIHISTTHCYSYYGAFEKYICRYNVNVYLYYKLVIPMVNVLFHQYILL